MKKFERFIIYPMLFIALFFSFSGEDVQQTTAQQVYDEIIAKNIKVVDDKGREAINLSGGNYNNKAFGSITIYDPVRMGGLYLMEGKNENDVFFKGTYDNITFIEEEKDKHEGSMSLDPKGLDIFNNNNQVSIQPEGIRLKNGNTNISTDIYPQQIQFHKENGNYPLVMLRKAPNNNGAVYIADKNKEKVGAYSYEGFVNTYEFENNE